MEYDNWDFCSCYRYCCWLIYFSRNTQTHPSIQTNIYRSRLGTALLNLTSASVCLALLLLLLLLLELMMHITTKVVTATTKIEWQLKLHTHTHTRSLNLEVNAAHASPAHMELLVNFTCMCSYINSCMLALSIVMSYVCSNGNMATATEQTYKHTCIHYLNT